MRHYGSIAIGGLFALGFLTFFHYQAAQISPNLLQIFGLGLVCALMPLSAMALTYSSFMGWQVLKPGWRLSTPAGQEPSRVRWRLSYPLYLMGILGLYALLALLFDLMAGLEWGATIRDSFFKNPGQELVQHNLFWHPDRVWFFGPAYTGLAAGALGILWRRPADLRFLAQEQRAQEADERPAREEDLRPLWRRRG